MKNKTGALIRLICFSILAAVLTSVLIIGITQKNFSLNLNLGMFSNNQYDNADKYNAGNTEITPDANGLKTLNITWLEGEVNVVPHKGKTIIVSEMAGQTIPKKDSVHTYYHDGILDIQYCESGKWSFGISNRVSNKQLQVKIPYDLCDDLESLDGTFVSANANISDIYTKRFVAETVSGEITYNGKVDSTDCESVSGNISVFSKTTPKDISMDTVSGDVVLAIPNSSEFKAEHDSVSGDLDCNFNITFTRQDDDSDSIICGSGNDGNYEFDSVSGDVCIKPVS